MRIVVLDGHTLNPGDNPWDAIAAQGELTVYERTPRELVVERSRDAEVLFTNKTPLDAQAIARLPDLRYVGVLATGYNIVDTAAARAGGIPVTNIPEYGTRSVAQHVFALLLELTNHIGLHDQAVRQDEWRKSGEFCFWKTPLVELADKTMAIVGFGRIGRQVGEIAHAFGMQVIAADPVRERAPAYSPFRWASVEEAFGQADVLSLNCPLTDSNLRFVDARLLSTMRRTAFLINASRGQLVNEEDLAAALRSGLLAGAAVDVVSVEPIDAANPLLAAPNCLVSPHIAWATLESRRRLMATAAANLAAFLSGRPVNVVN